MPDGKWKPKQLELRWLIRSSPPAKAFDIARLDRLASRRLELYHIVAIADEDAGYSDGRASVRRRGAKLSIAALIMHLPVHRPTQSRS